MCSNYDGWWYFLDDTLTNPEGKNNNSDGSRCTSPSPMDVAKEIWIPMRADDVYQLEAAVLDPSTCVLPDEVVIHDDSTQRLTKVNIKTMELKPIYWDGSSKQVRRSIWLQMKSTTDGILGGNPVPLEWDSILDKAYKEHATWLESSSPGNKSEIVEKIVDLSDKLSNYVMILRKGSLDTARLTEKSRLDNKPSIFTRDNSIKLIRGYQPFYIAVTSAFKEAELQGKNSDVPIILANPFEPKEAGQPQAPASLIFAIHGIGQKLAGRLGNNFVGDCDALREQTKFAIAQRSGNTEDLFILPVSWRRCLQMGIRAYFPESKKEDETFENLVSMITIPNVPAIRDVASDVGLDILLYMTPVYFYRIIKATLNEIRRMYRLFLKIGGEGAEKTKISLLGHSLGTAIISDLLSFIVEEDTPEFYKKATEGVVKNLGFKVENFFALGSPLALFFLLKQLKPIGCVREEFFEQIKPDLDASDEDRTVYPSLPDPSNSEDIKPRKMVFACKQVYNIFHPFDPIAYRMEPLIISPEEMGNFAYPVRLPYYKKGALHLKRQVQEQVQCLQDKAQKARENFMNALPDWVKSRLSSSPPKDLLTSAIDDEQTEDAPKGHKKLGIHASLAKFNKHGRVDFALEEPLLEYSYISAVRSHFEYWQDVDIASFLAVEVVGLPVNVSSPKLGQFK